MTAQEFCTNLFLACMFFWYGWQMRIDMEDLSPVPSAITTAKLLVACVVFWIAVKGL